MLDLGQLEHELWKITDQSHFTEGGRKSRQSL